MLLRKERLILLKPGYKRGDTDKILQLWLSRCVREGKDIPVEKRERGREIWGAGGEKKRKRKGRLKCHERMYVRETNHLFTYLLSAYYVSANYSRLW